MAAKLYAEIEEESRSAVPVKCKTCLAYAALESEDQEDLARAFEDHRITSTAIMKVLNRRGFDLSETSVRRHRRDCRRG